MTDRCPECGSRTTPYTITTNPPIHGVICYNCGWTHEDITNKIEKEKPVSDNVNKPSHYTQGGIECIDAVDSDREEWKPFPGHGNYEVSDRGNVRRAMDKRGRKAVPIKNGYLTVMLVENGKHKLEYVHRAVAKAFIPNPHKLPQVNHIDYNRKNNCVGNLEWCSIQRNIQHSKGKRIVQYNDDGEKVGDYRCGREAERAMGVPHGSIDRAARGQYKKAYGFIWRYEE